VTPPEGDPARRLAEPPTEAPFPPPAPWVGRTFAALGNRNYRRFFVGYCLSMVGSWARSAAQQWLVYDVAPPETRERWLSWVAAALLLPIPLLAIPAGALVDRVDKRRALIWILVLETAIAAVLAALVIAGRATPEAILALALAHGVAIAFEMPCRQAFVVEMVGKEGLRNAVALNSAMFNLALVVGPALGTWMMATFGIGSVFVFDAVSFAAAMAGLALLRLPPRAPVPREESVRRALLAGVVYVGRDRALRTLLLLLALAMVFGWSYASLLAAYTRDVLRVGQREYGLLFASSGVGACLGAVWIAGRGGGRPHRVLFGSLWAFAGSLVAMALVHDLGLAIVARAAAGFSMIVFFATGNASLQLTVPDAIRGRAMALWTFVFGASLPLGQLLMGAAAGRLGTPRAFAAGGAVVLLASVAVALTRPFRAPDPDPVPTTLGGR
jgi:MFS family permease